MLRCVLESRGKSAELESECCLEQQLDEDMAQTLAEDDHNADKKFGVGSQTDVCDGAVTQTCLIASTAVKSSSSNAAVSASSVSRDDQDRETSLVTASHPAPG